MAVTQTFIPGYQAAVTINLEDLTVVGQVIGYSDDATALPKPVFGTRYRNTVRGQGVVSIDVSGHLSAETITALMTMNAIPIPVTYSIQMGEIGGLTDSGILSGLAVITNLTLGDDATANWSWSLTLESDGDPEYTPAVAP
jgi:hypothetical protein